MCKKQLEKNKPRRCQAVFVTVGAAVRVACAEVAVAAEKRPRMASSGSDLRDDNPVVSADPAASTATVSTDSALLRTVSESVPPGTVLQPPAVEVGEHDTNTLVVENPSSFILAQPVSSGSAAATAPLPPHRAIVSAPPVRPVPMHNTVSLDVF